MKKFREKLNGNTGIVITTGMIVCLISIVTLGLVLIDRVDAMTEIKIENKMNCLEMDLTEQLHSIDSRLAVIESKMIDR